MRWRAGKIGTVYCVGEPSRFPCCVFHIFSFAICLLRGWGTLGELRQELTQKSVLLAFVSSARSSYSDDALLYIIQLYTLIHQVALGEHPESTFREHSEHIQSTHREHLPHLRSIPWSAVFASFRLREIYAINVFMFKCTLPKTIEFKD